VTYLVVFPQLNRKRVRRAGRRYIGVLATQQGRLNVHVSVGKVDPVVPLARVPEILRSVHPTTVQLLR